MEDTHGDDLACATILETSSSGTDTRPSTSDGMVALVDASAADKPRTVLPSLPLRGIRAVSAPLVTSRCSGRIESKPARKELRQDQRGFPGFESSQLKGGAVNAGG